MDLKGYKVKGSTICECGYEFTIKDMKKLQRINDTKFYGGIVRHVDEINCPHCNREILLLIKQTGQTYIVKDIAQKEDQNINNIAEMSRIENDPNINSNNEILCPICKKSFKSKSGLSIHLKTHENKDIN